MTITILSPGAIIVLILAAALGITILIRLARADDRRHPPVPGCPWCDGRTGPCDCTGPCGRSTCKAAQVGEDTADMLEYGDVIEGFERLLKEGHGRD